MAKVTRLADYRQSIQPKCHSCKRPIRPTCPNNLLCGECELYFEFADALAAFRKAVCQHGGGDAA